MMTIGQAEIHYQRGEYLNEAGRYDEAIEDFNKVLEFVKDGGVEKSSWLAGGYSVQLHTRIGDETNLVTKQKHLSI